MKRLIKRTLYDREKHYGSIEIPYDDLNYLKLVYDKLGKVEDIEEEIGIDLVTLFKAQMQDKIYYKDVLSNCKIKGCYVAYGTKGHILGKPVYALVLHNNNGFSAIVYASDYGTTWALTKEELE